MFGAFVHGLILAFGLILPLGAQNTFVFNQGAIQGRYVRALPVVVTAALCDTLLILLAVLGVSVLVLGSSVIKGLLLGAGTLFLLYMGWVIWHTRPAAPGQDDAAPSMGFARQVVFAVSVSLLNPHAILDTVAVIGTSSLSYSGEPRAAFTAAAVLVSWVWFFSLALAGRLVGRLDRSGRLLTAVNRVSAVIMWGSALYIGRQLAG
ncbi:MAG: LysE/ArgO family amino acid transporter [Thermoanaerobacterales bacterium]|nr:LysE/ArgO family amino acid transporter [Thermoanaerobacterales bacterium]